LVLLEKQLSGTLCTGEVISPHVILTAAHCVDPKTVGTGGKLKVFLGNDLSKARADQYVAVKEFHYDMEWDINNPEGGHDIAVVITQTAMTMTPMVMNTKPLEMAMLGMPVRFVGYGVTSGTDAEGTSAGVKRHVMTKLSGYNDVFVNFNDALHITCTGDSGGPALMKLDGQNEVIVGVTSYGDRNCSKFSVDTRVDYYVSSFVQPYIDQFDPAPSGGKPAGTGTTKGGCATGGDLSTGGGTVLLLIAAWLLARGLRA
jgi:secreted trypsin-like serine protease